jgi:hypothetical protein
MLDKNLKPWIMGLDIRPSLNIHRDTYWMQKEDQVISLVDLEVKKRILSDAIELAMMSSSELAAITNKFKDYERVFPSKDPNNKNLSQTILQLRYLFYKLCSVKENYLICSSLFEQLAQNKYLEQNWFDKEVKVTSSQREKVVQTMFHKVNGC